MGMGGRALCLDQPRSRALRLGQTWEVPAWEIAQLEPVVNLESCCLGKSLWEISKYQNMKPTKQMTFRSKLRTE